MKQNIVQKLDQIRIDHLELSKYCEDRAQEATNGHIGPLYNHDIYMQMSKMAKDINTLAWALRALIDPHS